MSYTIALLFAIPSGQVCLSALNISSVTILRVYEVEALLAAFMLGPRFGSQSALQQVSIPSRPYMTGQLCAAASRASLQACKR